MPQEGIELACGQLQSGKRRTSRSAIVEKYEYERNHHPVQSKDNLMLDAFFESNLEGRRPVDPVWRNKSTLRSIEIVQSKNP